MALQDGVVSRRRYMELEEDVNTLGSWISPRTGLLFTKSLPSLRVIAQFLSVNPHVEQEVFAP